MVNKLVLLEEITGENAVGLTAVAYHLHISSLLVEKQIEAERGRSRKRERNRRRERTRKRQSERDRESERKISYTYFIRLAHLASSFVDND